ncbi:ATP-binding protein [Acetivibrio clariflavus]|uniref:DNA replication protein n=1 Tax=Acetivibrio clariflavus (strain DSM 19732 / NBRC 101661 / EBR45) TaxID=720554 RepID=G8LZZ6_ACECE|nr:ATP-binding protein [Acetivibrio clariflavus]AEV70103.1 DNA replication protein [Acetivibrio clariflavus DSM 19732]
MADITEIRELAQKLNLWNIARGYIDLNDEKLSNLDYLQMILHKELEIRARQKQIKLRRASKLPNKVFELSNLNKGLEWQIKQLYHLMWLNEEQNVILLGKCGTGKTSLAVHLGETAIDNGHKTYYAPFDNFIAVAEKKATNPKAEAIFSYMQECDLIIIDDVFYVEPTRAELQVFYRAVTFLNETRSIIFITNRELSAWIDAAEDKHLCQTLLDRMMANCQIVRLTDK